MRGNIDFGSIQRNRSRRMGAIIAALVMILLIGGYITALACLFLGEGGPSEHVGLLIFVGIYTVAGLTVIIGVLAALGQRLREVRSGEEEEARKY